MRIERRATFISTRKLVVLAAVVIGALLLYLLRIGNDDRSATPHRGAQPQARLDLEGLTWNDFHGMRLPRSPSDGPRRTDSDLVSGFDHTPNGALLAAIHIVVRAAPQWAPDVFESTITHQVIGPDKVELLESIRNAHEQLRKRARLPVGVALGRAYAVIEGFRFLGYTPALASLDLLSAGPGEDDLTVRAATRVQLRWHDGDWRAICPLGGDWGSSAVPITSTAGYTLFPTGR